MGSELIFRGHESQPVSDAYSPKRPKPWLSDIRPIRYMLREQRLVFLFVGIAIATLVFILRPSSKSPAPIGNSYFSSELNQPHRAIYQNGHLINGFGFNSVGKIPLGLKRKGLRIVVTGGAGSWGVIWLTGLSKEAIA
ncbi:UDP-glucuronic acid decarboxylase 2 [Sesamum angolense]|uniref:UDP-glucuronic acid decarboxylase 2 n=1 Tax=Sesamum angolense TaxID=2727404 RepID=A0AAE1X9Y9_9LAMI|nr:UDP-glucuronic acid decarboxylase 2 [Sesamum angolense]